jgi:dual oxidase
LKIFSIFTKEEIESLRKVTLWDVIVNSTSIAPHHMQKNVFFWMNGDPCPQPMQLNASLMEPCKILNGYDYFEVNKSINKSIDRGLKCVYTHFKTN